LLSGLVPWCLHFHHAVRTCAQIAIFTLFENQPPTDPYLLSMLTFLHENKDCSRLRERQKWFATKSDRNLDENEKLSMSLFEQVKKSVKEFQGALSSETSTKSNQEMSDFQKRILPWQSLEMLRPTLASHRNSRQKLVVVASLVDNTPNIAGLIRTCEIFNVEEVVIGNKAVVQDAQFQRISVSAEKWVPILEVNSKNLSLYLADKKNEGYTILGVEQTAHSESLEAYDFPEKCVLVLGQEQLGIPPDILLLLDKCIEIPQLGVIRSLNVHVSASIVIWQYTSKRMAHSE